MNILEYQIEDLIYNSLKDKKGKQLLIDRGLRFLSNYDYFERQVNLGGYGILDLIGFNFNPRGGIPGHIHKLLQVVIIENKKEEINAATLLQAARYCKGISHLFNHTSFDINFNIVMIGKKICQSDFCFIPAILNNVDVFTFSLDIEKGMLFKSERYWTHNTAPEPEDHYIDSFKGYVVSKIKGKYREFPDFNIEDLLMFQNG